MANIIKLKDKNQAPCYPITIAQAVLDDNGDATIDKVLYSNTVTFTALSSANWRLITVPITNTLDVGYYDIKITGALDPLTSSTRLYVSKKGNITGSDIELPLINGTPLPDDGCITFNITSSNNIENCKYISFAQYSANAGTVTVELFKHDQLRHRIYGDERLVYKPVASVSRGVGAVGTGNWYAAWGDAKLTPGDYIVKISGNPNTSATTRLRLMSAKTLNTSDTVKILRNDGTVVNGESFKVSVTSEEAAQTLYLCVAQYTSDLTYIVVELFKADQLYWRVNDLEQSSDIGLPNYYYNDGWLDSRLTAINTNNEIINGISFAFITDLHFSSNDGNSKYLLKKVLDNTTVPFVMCGGDIVAATGTAAVLKSQAEKLVEYQNYVGKDKFFAVRGNHDFYCRDTSTSTTSYHYLTEGKAYDVLNRNSEYRVVDLNNAHLCYAVEVPSQMTVFLMINSKDGTGDLQSYISGAQASWIAEELLKYKSYKIIAISHIPADSAVGGYDSPQVIVHSLLSAFNNRTNFSTTHEGTSISANFTSATGKVVCHINGHHHGDDSHTADNVLSIVTTCDAHYKDDGYDATTGTVTEQAFDVFSIDYDNSTIKAVRIGRGSSRSWTY